MTDILSKIRAKVGHGINVVAVNTGKFVDETKLRGRIGTLEKERSALVEELGSIVYVSARKGKNDQARVEAKVKEIAAVDERIEAANREIEAIEARAQEEIGAKRLVRGETAMCACKARIEPGAKFCGSCGAKIPA